MDASLLTWLENATGPDRVIDARIWAEINNRDVRIDLCSYLDRQGLIAKRRELPYDECVVGVFSNTDPFDFYTIGQIDAPLKYTKSIDAAMTLMPELTQMELPLKLILSVSESGFGVMVSNWKWGEVTGTGQNYAIALCIAILRVRNYL